MRRLFVVKRPLRAFGVPAGEDPPALPHPWRDRARFVDAAAAEGVTVTPAALEAAPFEVELTARLLAERAKHLG